MQDSEGKPTQSKTSFSSVLGIPPLGTRLEFVSPESSRGSISNLVPDGGILKIINQGLDIWLYLQY